MNNSLTDDNVETIDAERAAVAMLLAAAAGEAQVETPAPEPTGNIIDLHRLWEQKAEIEQTLKATENQEIALRKQLDSVLETKVDLIRRQQAIQVQAAKLCEVLFGTGITRQVEQPPQSQPTTPPVGSAAPPRKSLDNSVVIDRNVPTPQSASSRVLDPHQMPNFNF